MRSRTRLMHFVLAAILLSPVFAHVRADEFVLSTGAKLRGQWLNQGDTSSPFYIVDTEYGGRVRLERSRVVRLMRQSGALDTYNQLAPTIADTVESHWKVAQWCRDNNLREQSQLHLVRVIELDPEHQSARRALGYSEIGGEWLKQNEYLERQGYVRYKGKWRLAQEVALAEQRQVEQCAKKDWHVKLSRWRTQLNKENKQKRRTALDNVLRVRDPLAIDAIERLLAVERDRQMRLIYVEVLAQILDSRAAASLVELALSDRDEEVFYSCIEQLAIRPSPSLVQLFVSALKSRHNDRVNRAAIALGLLGEQASIPPLIDALVTRHEFVLPGNDMISSTFARGGATNQTGGTFTAGASPPEVLVQTAPNQEVLRTLVKLTGVSFSFDQRAWRNWYALQQSNPGSVGRSTPD